MTIEELEKEWRAELRETLRVNVPIMARTKEARAALKENIKIQRDILIQLHLERNQYFNRAANMDNRMAGDYVYYKHLIDLANANISSTLLTIHRLESKLKISRMRKSSVNPVIIPSVDLARIKEEVSAVDILGEPKKRYGVKLYYICIFHTDKNPSLIWFTNKHNYHCFSCGAHGSNLDLYMKYNNVDLKTAIQELQKYL